MKKAYSLFFLLLLLTGFNCTTKSESSCITITCLDHPRDTLSQKLHEVKTCFLVESRGDTLSNFDIRSSCGCEYPAWKKNMKIYPGHPDTVMIVSLLKDHPGHWQKYTTLKTGHCTTSFYTGPWYITD